ncbi:histidine phosphatase family protein [Glutamicibacter sp.]|uniref:histidine phosphatase family protein n=1 Tax=Glutamicibacter sp. TaxID=1931995 RepID=UPI0028BE1F3B|nr:histidine phosphatase family protein [Glutamicibacter sp.]
MDTALALVRHGQTDWNLVGRLQGRTDIELNETGRNQARRLGRYLRGKEWDLILASPLGRAQETAALIAEQAGMSTGPAVPELIERGFGSLEGRIMSEVSDEEAALVNHELETHPAILDRALPALLELAQQYAGQRVMIVSHGATMRTVRDALAGERLQKSVENGEILEIDLQLLSELHQQRQQAPGKVGQLN